MNQKENNKCSHLCKFFRAESISNKKLSEAFIIEFKSKVSWPDISFSQKLSEHFIRKFKNKVRWSIISEHQTLSEDFIREFAGKVDWKNICEKQNLSESFIREFKNRVDWYCISQYQTLSESFIREFEHLWDWTSVSNNQTLSEDFIREYKDVVDWPFIQKYQNLSEDFIMEFKDKVDWKYIQKYQYLSEEFRKKINLPIPKNSWLYKTDKEKLELVKNTGLYEIEDNCVIAYKSVKSDFSSVYKHGIYYHPGSTVSAHCNCNPGEQNSFGLSAWTQKGALRYYNKGLLLKVRIPISKLGCLVHDSHKIRCFELEVMEVVEK